MANPAPAEAIARAEAHVRARLTGTESGQLAVTHEPGPASFTVVRAARPGAYPGTGVAIALVSPGGRVFGAGTDNDLARLVDEVGFDPSPAGAKILAQLVALAHFDGMVAVVDPPPPRLSLGADGIELEAVVRGALARTEERLAVTIPSTGSPTVIKQPLPSAPAPIPIDRATALERAFQSNDAMAIQKALRALKPPLSEREMTIIAKVALRAGGQLAVQARRQLGEGPAAEDALTRARAELSGAAP